MNPRVKKLNELQEECAEKMFQAQWATAELATGVGKTFTSFKACYKVKELAENTYEKKYRPTVLVLAETTVRDATFRKEADDFFKIFGKHFYKDFKVTFACYQAQMERRSFDILIADEWHDGLTPAYSQVLSKCKFHYVFGLSALMPDTPFDSNSEERVPMTKREYCQEVTPIVFTYSLIDAIREGILSPFETTVIYHDLDDTTKNIVDKIAKKKVKLTEKEYYTVRAYKSNAIKAQLALEKRKATPKESYLLRKYGLENTRLLWGLPSKSQSVKDFLKENDKKAIVFATDLSLAHSITKKTVSSRNSDVLNKSIIAKFNNNKIKTIGSFKMLKQGITLEGVEHVYLASYFSSLKDLIQELGRVLRFVEGKVAKLFIYVTKDTLEEKWFNSLCEELPLNIVERINYGESN